MRGRILHLATRFFSGLKPVQIKASDTAWAQEFLTDDEYKLWARYGERDKVHTVAVGRAVEQWAAGHASVLDVHGVDTESLVAAGLLHDIGKADTPLGLFGRVAATIGEAVAGPRMKRFEDRDDPLGAIARYCDYPERGAELLRASGSTDLAADWAAQHHGAEDSWTVPAELGRVLVSADNSEKLHSA